METEASLPLQKYFASINKEVELAYALAKSAREQGYDPEDEVPIPVAKNMAERVVGLISVVAPQILHKGIPERILQLEKKYGLLDWRVGFVIAEEVAQQKFCSFENKLEAMEVGIRVGFAYLTLGIVSAPLEGFIGLKLKKTQSGGEFFSLQFAGPIRAAGGTAQSVCAILADYVRVKMGYDKWDPTEKEILRLMGEVHDYHERVTNLQYHPNDDELRHLITHLPVEIDGDPTEKLEVSNHKDLPRIETNLIRGGVCLVLGEGLSQKVPKLWKKVSVWGKEMGLEWEWLGEQKKLKESVHAKGSSNIPKKEEKKTVKANNTFIMDLVAGRPILTHPLREGGFRLRYGRTRMSGYSTSACHPATLIVLEKYIAIGTQLKVERPGKATTISVCEVLEGPVVKLSDGSVIQLSTEDEAKRTSKDIVEVIFLGDILFDYGDFSENGHPLVPVGYCPEWWVLELERAVEKKENLVFSSEKIMSFIKNPFTNLPSVNDSLKLTKELSVPLHPAYTYYWKLISSQDLQDLRFYLSEGKLKKEGQEISKIVLPLYGNQENHKKGKRILELLGIPHKVINKESLILEKQAAQILGISFSFSSQEQISTKQQIPIKGNGLESINEVSSVPIRDKAGTFIGARMGRPEKAKMRHLTGSPQVMFPVGEEGDRLRSFQSALKAGKIRSTFPLMHCKKCKKDSIYRVCEDCGERTEKKYFCRFCGDLPGNECRHGEGNAYKTLDLDIKHYFNKAKDLLGSSIHPDLIKGVRGTSNKDHVVEHLVKGILRAKHRVYVNKDGTTRYDCTELPITHFKPKEIKTSLERLKKLGYTHDIKGEPLISEEQVLELRPQDVILPGFSSLEESAPAVLTRVANFVDELLIKLYKLPPYFSLKKEEDLVGHLVIGLAPHISAGLVGRIIGFSETQGLLTHPMYHAGMRRDCDGDEACVMLLMDALLNFSRQYLPERRGAKTMDAPLVLTSTLYPTQVDDQVHGIGVAWQYPLELYEAAQEMKNPWEVKVAQLAKRLETEKQYEDFGFTHPVNDFNKGVQCSAYKILPSMKEKLIGQMDIAQKVRAVDIDDVARLVIQRHFLRDIKGNLRKFSMQKFRCVKCNESYRRPPLQNKCMVCGGKLLFTITHGSVVKYLGPSLELAEKYDFSPFLKETLELLQLDVDYIFGREKDKQVGLGSFIS